LEVIDFFLSLIGVNIDQLMKEFVVILEYIGQQSQRPLLHPKESWLVQAWRSEQLLLHD
jgi:hypothetical protein